MSFKKYDTGKPRMSLVGRLWLWGTIRVLEIGAKKYGADNWRKGCEWSRYWDALHRHLWAWWQGEELDPESSEHHLHHASCCLMFLAEMAEGQFGTDDRPCHR